MSPMACAKARCLGCRKWFTPDRRTATRQKRCTRKCGTRHRRAQAKARRYADLETYRASERERQRAGRERRREGVASAGAPEKVEPSALSGAMSRAEWSAQVLAITMVIVEKMDKVASLSRAEFGRQVAKIMKEGVNSLGKACA